MAPPPGLTPPFGPALGSSPSTSRNLINPTVQSVYTWGQFSHAPIPSRFLLILCHSLEIDYVAAAHAIWLTGRTTVVLSPKWSQDVTNAILERTQVKLVLYGNTKPCSMSVQTVCTTELIVPKPPIACPPPASHEVIQKVPAICSITPTSGSTGVPKSIVYPMKRALSTLDEESSTLLKPRDGQWLRGGTVSFSPAFSPRFFPSDFIP